MAETEVHRFIAGHRFSFQDVKEILTALEAAGCDMQAVNFGFFRRDGAAPNQSHVLYASAPKIEGADA